MAETVVLRMTASQYATIDAMIEIAEEDWKRNYTARPEFRAEVMADFAAYNRATGKDKQYGANDPDQMPPGEVVFDMTKAGN